MLKRKIYCNNKIYYISIFSVWLKLNFSNNYEILSEKCSWKVSQKIKTLLRLCAICRVGIWIILYLLLFSYFGKYLLHAENNLFYVMINILLLIFPVLVFEMVLLYIIKIECKFNSG